MTMKRVDEALQRLFEDPGLREDLVDDDAEVLMQWAESKLAELDSKGEDDAQFEAHVDTVKEMVKAVNRFVGKGKPDALQTIVQHATALGQPIALDAAAQAASQPTVQSVLSMFTQAASAPAEAPRMTRQEVEPEHAEPIDSPFHFMFGGKNEPPPEVPEQPENVTGAGAWGKTEPESAASSWGKSAPETEPASSAALWGKSESETEPKSSASLWGKTAKSEDDDAEDVKTDKPSATFLGWSGRTSDDSTPDSGDRA